MTNPRDRDHRLEWAVLVSASVLALTLRVWMAARLPLEQDELYTFLEARDLLQTTLQPGIQARPLYYLLLHPLLPLLPNSPMGQRLVPLFFAVSGLVVTFLLGQAIAGRKAAIVALILVAFSPWHLYASSMARYWSLVYLLSACGALALVYREDSPRKRQQLTAAMVLVAAFTVHPSVMVMWSAPLGLLAARWLIPRLRPQASSLGTEVIYFWIPLVAGAAGIAAFAYFFRPGAGMTNWGGRGIGASLRLLPAIVQLGTPLFWLAALLGALVCLCRGSPRRRTVGLVGAGMIVGGPLVLAVLSFRTNIYADYALAGLPIFVAMAAYLLSELRWNQREVFFAGALGIVAASLPEVGSQLLNGMRFDPRPALVRAQERDPGIPIVGWPLIVLRHYAPNVEVIEPPPVIKGLDSLLNTRGALWFVASRSRYGTLGPAGNEVDPWLARRCREEGRWRDKRLDVRVYQVSLYRCARG